jgi:hypothetical protein
MEIPTVRDVTLGIRSNGSSSPKILIATQKVQNVAVFDARKRKISWHMYRIFRTRQPISSVTIKRVLFRKKVTHQNERIH